MAMRNGEQVCDDCGSKLILLLFSAVCDNCNQPGSSTSTEGEKAYVVWRSRPGLCEYIFKTEEDTEKWRTAAGVTRYPIREIRTRRPVKWRQSTGSVRDLVLADRLYEIHETKESFGRSDTPWAAYLC